MIPQLLQALVQSQNEAADDVLLDALRKGTETEQGIVLPALLRRKTTYGLVGVMRNFDALPDVHRNTILQQIKLFHGALREAGRSDNSQLRLCALKLIALGRQGKLTYILSESLHSTDDALAKGAVDAMVALARWVAGETRRLQRGIKPETATDDSEKAAADAYHELMDQRPDIEQAIARAIDVHRGAHGQDLLRAGLLLADWPGSKTLTILQTAKHGGQNAMLRRLQQPPESEQVEAFLLAAAHAGLRSHFPIVFSRIEEAPVLDALLRKTHWLKDLQLELCMHQVNRGVWWGDEELRHDLGRRDPSDVGSIGEWLAVSGIHDVVQDERMDVLRKHAADNFSGRLRLLRIALRRPRGASVALVRSFLADPDERLVRMAAREIVRRRPADFENILLQLMTTAGPTVRSVITRSVGQVGFEHFWNRFDQMESVTRKAAGRAMLKILPDGLQRLARKLSNPPLQQQLKAIHVAQELHVVDQLAEPMSDLCRDPNPKIRSKAVAALGEMVEVPSQVLLDHVLNDTDSRVRANAIEVLESKQRTEYLPMLTQRARAAPNRERANAIKAIHRMKVGTASTQLSTMLQDERAEHRISALWTLKQIGWWKLLKEVGRLAKEDPNLRVRRYAFALLRDVSQMVADRETKAAG